MTEPQIPPPSESTAGQGVIQHPSGLRAEVSSLSHGASPVLEGIDVSNAQGYVDWLSVKQAGKRFGIVKATEGLGYQDPWFNHNWSGLWTRGLHRIAYHFFHPSLNGSDQADYVHSWVRENGHFQIGDGIALDLELTDGESALQILANAEAFVRRCWSQTRATVLLYTYPDFWLNTLGNPRSEVLSQCPLWMADYGPATPVFSNWPQGLSFWQYSSTGHCPGVSGQVDLDRFYGSESQISRILHARAG